MKFGIFKIGLLALALAAPFLCAQHASGSAPLDGCSVASEGLAQRFVLADFNNDEKPDSISLWGLGRRGGKSAFGVRICVGGRLVDLFTLDSSDPSIALSAIDVNHDHSPDIVVEQLFTQKRIQVWLNDGHGRFHQAHADSFRSADARAPNTVSLPAKERHSPRRAQLRRGTKLSIQRAKLPTTSRYSPPRRLPSLTARYLQEPGGPNLSRAPPVAVSL